MKSRGDKWHDKNNIKQCMGRVTEQTKEVLGKTAVCGDVRGSQVCVSILSWVL